MSDHTHIQWTDAVMMKRAYDRKRYLRLRDDRISKRPTDPIVLLSEIDVAYIAGLIDGEGSIYVMKHRDKTFYPAVSICMTHSGVLVWLAEKLGLSMSEVPRTPAGWRDQYSVRIHGARAVLLCGRMLPYLKVKRLQAELVQAFPGDQRKAPGATIDPSVNAKRQAMREKVNALNARGIPA